MTAARTAIRGRSGALRWSAMARVATAMMVHGRLKSLGTLIGVVFAVILSNQQAGTFLGLLHKNVMFVKSLPADVWITPASTETLQAGKPVSLAAYHLARVAPGVAWAEPLLFGGAAISTPSGGSEAVTLVGARAPYVHGGPWNIVAGDLAALGRRDTMFFEDSEREKLGGLNLGSVRELSGHRVIVGGFTWGLLPFGPSYAFADFDLARELLHSPSDQASFVLVGVEPGADPTEVAARLQAQLPEVKVMTSKAFQGSIVNYLLTRTSIGISFGTSTLFGLIVGFVVVALSMFSAVIDNLREFGTLKAIGATNWDLARLLLVQSVAYALLGSLVGLAAVTQIAGAIRSPQLAVILPPEMLLGTTLGMVLLCIFASSLALFRLRNLEPAMVFR